MNKKDGVQSPEILRYTHSASSLQMSAGPVPE